MTTIANALTSLGVTEWVLRGEPTNEEEFNQMFRKVTGADANGATLSYTADNINVFLNGVRLDATDYTASNGTSVVLGAGATASDELVVTAYKSFTTADMVSASAGGTFNNNVSFGDNNITNVGSIALDSISADGTGITINDKLTLKKEAFMKTLHQSWVLGG